MWAKSLYERRIGYRFRRGFVWMIDVDATGWELHHNMVLTEYPITEVQLKTLPSLYVGFNDDEPTEYLLRDGALQKHDSADACYAEWESRWPQIKFIRPVIDVSFRRGSLITLPAGITVVPLAPGQSVEAGQQVYWNYETGTVITNPNQPEGAE